MLFETARVSLFGIDCSVHIRVFVISTVFELNYWSWLVVVAVAAPIFAAALYDGTGG